MMTLKQEVKDTGSDTRMVETEEKGSQRLPPRTKRQSLALESNLPNIEETEEGKKDDLKEDHEDSVFEHVQAVPRIHSPKTGVSIFQTEIDHDSYSGKDSTNGKQLERKSSTQSSARTSDVNSVKSEPARMKAESRIAHADDFETNRTPESSVTKTNTLNRHRNCSGSSKSSLTALTKLDLRSTGNQDAKGEDGKSDSNSQRSSLTDTSVPGDFSRKLPQVKCVHSSAKSGAGTGEKMNKNVKWKSSKTCMICEMTDETERMTQTESNKLLLEIVYPHEFYDRFSRARNSRKNIVPQGNTKESISICKPAKVTRKVVQPDKSLNRVPQATTRVQEEGGGLQYSGSSGNIPEKKRKQESVEETEAGKKEIHVQCKPKMNASVVTDTERGQRMVLKGLKGWILRKHDECKNKMYRDIKQSLYQVSTLGVQFGMPEYNTSLHDRKLQSPRLVTCLTSRSQDNGIVIRPNTHTLGPRQRTMPSAPRDLLSGQSRGFGALQRDLTNINPRLPAAPESKPQHVPQAKHLGSVSNSSQKSLEHSIAKVMKTGLSLPPISNDVKTHVALAHTPT